MSTGRSQVCSSSRQRVCYSAWAESREPSSSSSSSSSSCRITDHNMRIHSQWRFEFLYFPNTHSVIYILNIIIIYYSLSSRLSSNCNFTNCPFKVNLTSFQSMFNIFLYSLILHLNIPVCVLVPPSPAVKRQHWRRLHSFFKTSVNDFHQTDGDDTLRNRDSTEEVT